MQNMVEAGKGLLAAAKTAADAQKAVTNAVKDAKDAGSKMAASAKSAAAVLAAQAKINMESCIANTAPITAVPCNPHRLPIYLLQAEALLGGRQPV